MSSHPKAASFINCQLQVEKYHIDENKIISSPWEELPTLIPGNSPAKINFLMCKVHLVRSLLNRKIIAIENRRWRTLLVLITQWTRLTWTMNQELYYDTLRNSQTVKIFVQKLHNFLNNNPHHRYGSKLGNRCLRLIEADSSGFKVYHLISLNISRFDEFNFHSVEEILSVARDQK